MANFGLRDMPLERDQALKVLHQRIEQYRDAPQNERGNNLFWISGRASGRWLFLCPDAYLYG